MSRYAELPLEAADYLKHLEQHLTAHPTDQRAEILEDIAGHIQAALDAGQPVTEVLARLGNPEAIASTPDDGATGYDERRYRMNAKRIVQIITLALTLAATLAILVTPSYLQVSSDSNGNESISTESVLTVVGTWFLAVLAIPNIIAVAPLLARGRVWQPVSIGSTVLLVGFGVVGALSVGFYFIPTILSSLVSVFLPTQTRRD
jgi:uncharacterized membrane protein